MKKTRMICFLAVLALTVSVCASAMGLSPTTLTLGSRGEEVRKLQQALIDLGYLKGKADGIYGNQTYLAVVSFQHVKKMTEDGLAGKKTQAAVYEAASKSSSSAKTEESSKKEESTKTEESSKTDTSSSSSSSSSSGNLFKGDYTTIRPKDRGDRVKIMQQALIRLKYLSGKADGIYGDKTLQAVKDFQKASKLNDDGLAGKKTLAALETADKNGKVKESSSSNASEESSDASSKSPSSSTTLAAPDGGTLKLLHWYNNVKPQLSSGNHLLVYDPTTGMTWTLKVTSLGRHCDAEPLTAEDTDRMKQAFGGQETWTQKGVYVRLPSGIWTVAATHDNPHKSGTIENNNFNGHLCVHFLRDMSETKANDPNYGVSNQNTIRSLWRRLTGEDLKN